VIVDYHMHLRGSDDEPRGRYSAERAEEYVEQARRTGVDEIGFSDHVYHFVQTSELWEIPWMLERCVDDLDEYVGAVTEAKARGLPVKLGLEVDYFPGTERELARLLAAYPWDYLLGSVHFVDGFPVDQEPGLVHKVPVGEAWRRYFTWLRNAAWGRRSRRISRQRSGLPSTTNTTSNSPAISFRSRSNSLNRRGRLASFR